MDPFGSRGRIEFCPASDIVITTAKVFGRKAPFLLTREMISGMCPGIIVDLAAVAAPVTEFGQ